MVRLLLIATAFVATGCSERVEKDTRPSFHINPAQPFRLEFGRGSGWHGLDTVRIDQNGNAVLHRLRRGTEKVWETATLQLQSSQSAELLGAVESNGLMHLHRAYHTDVHDGTQWVFWVKQGEREKSVYFNNNFPQPITRFAEQLDGILSSAGLDKAAWQPVPEVEARRHETELWDSIKR